MNEEFALALIAELMPQLANEAMPRAKMLAEYDRLATCERANEIFESWADQEPSDAPLLETARRDMMPALVHIEELFREIPRQWSRVFWQGRSKIPDPHLTRFGENRYTGLAQLRPDGAPPMRDTAAGGERFVYNTYPSRTALQSAPITKDLAEGDAAALVKALVNNLKGMANSFAQTEEILHAAVLNTADVYNPAIGGDGVPLLSEYHPYAGGDVYSNRLSRDIDLNDATYEDAVLMIRSLVNQAGMRVLARPRAIVVPPELEFKAARLIAQLPEAVRPPEGYVVLDFLTAPKRWFVTTSIPGLHSYERQPFRLDLLIEDGNLVIDGSQSRAIGYHNPRAIVGN